MGDTLTDSSEVATLTFNDLILPLESSPNNATLNNSSIKETMHDSSTVTTTPTNADAVKYIYIDHNLGAESMDVAENSSGSEDSGTFTVTSSSTLSHSLSCAVLNSTLLHTNQEDASPKTETQENVAMKKDISLKNETLESVAMTEEVTNTSVGLQVDSRGSDEQSAAMSMKTEIRDILKLQQQQLLSMLKTMEAKTTREVVKNVDCGTQIDFEDESFLPQGSVLAATKENAQPSTAQTLKKEESLDDTMPVSVFVSTHSCA